MSNIFSFRCIKSRLTSGSRRDCAPKESGHSPEDPETGSQNTEHPLAKRLKFPANSDGRRGGQRSQAEQDESNPDFQQRPPTKGKLWNEGEPPLPRSFAGQQTQAQAQAQTPQRNTLQGTRPSERSNQNKSSGGRSAEAKAPSVTEMIKQLETRPISQKQLIKEVQGIYTGFIMVEMKYIEVNLA